METKVCSKCGVEKELSEFYLAYGKPVARCKKCFNEDNKNSKNRKKYLYEYCRTEDYRSKKRNSAKIRAKTDNQKAYQLEYRKTENFKLRAKKRRQTDSYKLGHRKNQKLYEKTDKGIEANVKFVLKNKIGAIPPSDLIELKILIIKTKRLCKTLKS